jgi:hypothetical protein
VSETSFLLAKEVERAHKLKTGLECVAKLIPEDYYDWEVHGVDTSERYKQIIQVVNFSLGSKKSDLQLTEPDVEKNHT